MYDMKALYQAASVEEAVALRLEHPEAQIIAGGSDVLVHAVCVLLHFHALQPPAPNQLHWPKQFLRHSKERLKIN